MELTPLPRMGFQARAWREKTYREYFSQVLRQIIRLAQRDVDHPNIIALSRYSWPRLFAHLKRRIKRQRHERGAYLAPEEIKAPIVCLQLGKGDCDCLTTLVTSIALAKGQPMEWGFFVDRETEDGPIFNHIWPIVRYKRKWVNFDLFRSFGKKAGREYYRMRVF